jgi:hypothetical protein
VHAEEVTARLAGGVIASERLTIPSRLPEKPKTPRINRKGPLCLPQFFRNSIHLRGGVGRALEGAKNFGPERRVVVEKVWRLEVVGRELQVLVLIDTAVAE